MAGRTNTEKIEDLFRQVHILTERVEAIKTTIDDYPTLLSRVAVVEQRVTDLKTTFEHQFADLKKSLETLHARLWQIGIPLIVGVIGALLTALLRK
jgi:hypothetical protein